MNASTGFGGHWFDLLIPVALLMIMISMGMELVIADFKRVLELPRAVAVGLVGQMVLLPSVGFALAWSGALGPTVALGVVIITACPGGATSNVFSYLARANIALSVTLTAFSSVLCFLTIPLWINLALRALPAAGDVGRSAVALPIGPAIAQLFVVTLLPVVIGMGIRARWPAWCARFRAPLRRSMAVLMAVAIGAIVASEWRTLARDFEVAAVAASSLVCGMLVLAYALGRVARLPERDAFTISIEVGLQNGALATLIVVNLLERPDLLVFPGTYAVLSLLPVTLWTFALRQRIAAAPA